MHRSISIFVGLSNPPGNFVIDAHTNISNFYLPYLKLSWIPPLQRGDVNELSYLVIVGDTLDQTNVISKLIPPSSTTNSTIIELSTDSIYIVTISVYRPSNIQGLQIRCITDTQERCKEGEKMQICSLSIFY